jgi:hypothetical protein
LSDEIINRETPASKDSGFTTANPDPKKTSRERLMEMYLWLFVAMLPVIRPYLLFITNRYSFNEAFPEILSSLFYSLFIFSIPVLSQMTFGILPFEALRTRLALKDTSKSPGAGLDGPQDWGAASAVEMPTPSTPLEKAIGLYEGKMRGNDPRDLLLRFAEESSGLAQRVYTRAGVYLMVGVLIAIGGLGFFYIRSLNLPAEKDLVDRALSLLPGFGILFFIEFVALFFLRQHRAAMDDFRYYDAVRRHREENLVILTMFAENTNVVPTADVIKVMSIYSGDQKLMQGETTEILEARRLQRDDIVIFEKLIEAFGAIRGAKERKK